MQLITPNRTNPVLYIVVPCYNEEATLPMSMAKLEEKLAQLAGAGTISRESRILFVDDGSRDSTWQLISQGHARTPTVCGIRFAHNRGHQTALFAGLMFARTRCDVSISIDADLQQDINVMDGFLRDYRAGSDIVYGVRNSRSTDGAFKKFTAEGFYSLIRWLGIDLLRNSADCRCMSCKALDALSEYSEVNLFLRGIIPDIGLKSSIVHFDVHERMAGHSQYTLGKMCKLAAIGLTAFTIRPIHFICAIGVAAMFLSFLMILWCVVEWALGMTVSGWATIICLINFYGGLITFVVGIVGEYVGRSYEETKRRPRYYLDDVACGDEPHERA